MCQPIRPSVDKYRKKLLSSLFSKASLEDLRVFSGKYASSARSCTCRDFVDKSGFGNCVKKSSSSASGKPLPVCYVKSPSNCTDLKNVDQDIGSLLGSNGRTYLVSKTGRDDYLMSFEACKGEIGVSESVMKGFLLFYVSFQGN